MKILKAKIEKIERVEKELRNIKRLKDIELGERDIKPCLCFTNGSDQGHYPVEINLDLFMAAIEAQEKQLNLSVEKDRQIVEAFELMLTSGEGE